MGSKTSKVRRPTPTKTKTVVIPIIPHDVINEILDYLATDSDFRPLRACALVSRSWVQPCQRRLFHTIIFAPWNVGKWLKTFPARERSHVWHLVRHLHLRIGMVTRIPKKFFECIPWFTDVDRMTFSGSGGVPLGYGGFSSSSEPSSWNLPRSVTSLTITTDVITLVQVREIVAQFPNLDDLALSGFFAPVDKRQLPGIGTVLKGRFSGRLMLHDVCVSEDVINMLLEIPSGLRFTDLEIHCTHNRLPSSAVRLAEACCKTLVKLSHTVGPHCKSYPFRLAAA